MITLTIREMLEKRANLIANARELVDRADKEDRTLDAAEQESYDKHFKDINDIDERIKKEESLREAERKLETYKPDDSPDDSPGAVVEDNKVVTATEDYRKAFQNYLKTGVKRGLVVGEDRESRALQMDVSEAGGYTVVPEVFARELLKAVDNMVFIRQYARVETLTNAASLGVPSLDADPADPVWTSELGIGDEDSTMDFGKRELSPHPLAKYIKVSRKLLRTSAFDIEGLVRDRLAYKFGVTEENAFLNGSGAGQPLGVFTASNDGISTGRDVATGNTATAMTFDGLKEAKYTMKANYWPRLRWVFHRDGVKQVSKLKDGEGQYIWQPSVVAGDPDRLLSFPVHMSEYAPNTFTTGLYVGLLGDFSYYWIVDALDMEMQRLVELYAATNQIGFIGRKETDGMPVLEEAFVRVKLGA
jgi:HK97 family phage major capsid protein